MSSVRAILGASLLLLLAPLAAGAIPGGGGGIEYLANFETSALHRIGLPSGALIDLPSGTVYGITGFGYRVGRDGWKVGGFGTAIFANGIRLELPTTNVVLTGMVGGIGGFLTGGQGRLGPIVLSGNCRIGCSGLAVRTENDPAFGRLGTTAGLVALYGSLDAEIGVQVFPAMMLSLFAGVNAFMPFSHDVAMTILPAPVAGMRITWGRF